MPLYFLNAIQSVLAKTTDDVFGFYNFIDYEDLANARNCLNIIQSDRLTLFFRKNESDSGVKTGSLYSAYNEAIEKSGEHDLIHFLQGDMQIMHWDTETTERVHKILDKSASSLSANVICVSTTFECRGKWSEEFRRKNLEYDQRLEVDVLRDVSMSDVGIFDLREIRRLGIKFGGHEVDMQRLLLAKGFIMPKLPVPTDAFIPWPVTVRDGRLQGAERLSNYPTPPLLGLREDYPSPNQDENLWMENWIFPNGWSCLIPYWPTGTDNLKWVRRRREGVQKGSFRMLSWISEDAKIRNHLIGSRNLVPRRRELVASIVRLGVASVIDELYVKAKRLTRFGRKVRKST